MTSARAAESDIVGENIVELQKMMSSRIIPPPNWIGKWQTMAEHIIAVAHVAKDKSDVKQLLVLDEEAGKLIAERRAKTEKA